MSSEPTTISNTKQTDNDTGTDNGKNVDTIANMKRTLLDAKVDGGKRSFWAKTLETFGMAHGKTKTEDIWVDSISDGLDLVDEYYRTASSTSKKEAAMKVVPLKEFNATQDQLFTSFLKWAEKEDPQSKNVKKINVSKVIRRLDSYFEWMEENKADFEQPLTLESIRAVAKVWNCQVTYDEEGRLIWWMDLGVMDKESIGAFEPREHLRYVVWFSHLIMFDKKAQNNGVIMIEDMGMAGFWKLSTLIPHEVTAKMDRLTIGILPVKVKKIYIFGAATWMKLLMGLLKPFLGKKMRGRVVVVPNKTTMQEFCDDLLKSRLKIPMGLRNLEGESPQDNHFETYNIH